jgi:hypothetical protein
MAVRLSALRAIRALLPGRFLVLVSIRGSVDLRVIVLLEGLGSIKIPTTSLGIETVTFRHVAQSPPTALLHALLFIYIWL